MEFDDKEFLKRLRETFKLEAEEHIGILSSGLIDLEKTDDGKKRSEITETVFREAHSLKGAARAVNMTNIEQLCQSIESVFKTLINGQQTLPTSAFNVLYETIDTLTGLLAAIDDDSGSFEQSELIQLMERLSRIAGETEPALEKDTGNTAGESTIPVSEPGHETAETDSIASSPAPETESPVTPPSPSSEKEPVQVTVPDTMRIAAAKLDPILLQAEELLAARLAMEQRINELKEMGSIVSSMEKRWKQYTAELRKRHRMADTAAFRDSSTAAITDETTDFIDWNTTQISRMQEQITAAMRAAVNDDHSIETMVETLLEDTKNVMMVSFSTLLEAFPRMVRDISLESEKEVDLVIHGGDIEIDRRILNEMKDPLIHLVRNSIEHGIETPEERKNNNKPAGGTVTLEISQQDGHIHILVEDDGRGIDITKIKETIRRSNVISAGEAAAMSEQEMLSLIFRSGFSTNPIITSISGRGLGLPIVREKIDSIGGNVTFETKPGEGTIFRIILPMTTATFRGVVVRTGEHRYIVPTGTIERVLRTNKEAVKTAENRQTIEIEGRIVSLARLAAILGSEDAHSSDDTETQLSIVIVEAGNSRLALQVDQIVDEREILIKTLGKQLLRVPNISGATILGSGEVVPVLNVADLLESAPKILEGTTVSKVSPGEKTQKRKTRILIAEDSITARTLVRNILEMAGYDVTVAVDGIDAFTRLRSDPYDIMISDVDMPRMNGFDLTARVRADSKLADIPVVLLTALESREDKERGIEAGANAYLVKSDFDQSDLLEVIRRLV